MIHYMTQVMYESFVVDFKLMKQLYYFKYYNQDVDYLHHVIMKHFHQLNKIE